MWVGHSCPTPLCVSPQRWGICLCLPHVNKLFTRKLLGIHPLLRYSESISATSSGFRGNQGSAKEIRPVWQKSVLVLCARLLCCFFLSLLEAPNPAPATGFRA